MVLRLSSLSLEIPSLSLYSPESILEISERRWVETVLVSSILFSYLDKAYCADNGYIQFTFVRVPRAHMLMKHTQVSRDGTVTDPVSLSAPIDSG